MKKNNSLICLLCVMLVILMAGCSIKQNATKKLIWSDEFDNTTIDKDK